MLFRTHIIVFLAVVSMVVTAFCGVLVLYDPLQLFSAKRPQWHGDMRVQMAGIINSYSDTFDSVIFGTSMTENASADEVSAMLGQKFVNVSASASDFYERHFMLRRLLRKKPIKSVIYTFDYVYLNQNMGFPNPPIVAGFPIYPPESFDFLYDENRVNDLTVYFKRHWLTCAFTWSPSPTCLGDKTQLDRPNAWFNNAHEKGKFGGLSQWAKWQRDPQLGHDIQKIHNATHTKSASPSEADKQFALARAEKYINTYFLSLVEQYPKTHFYVIFPPYSRAKQAIWYHAEPLDFATHQSALRYMVNATKTHANLHIFAYEDRDFPDDIANYKDLLHFHPRFNTRFHQDIADKRELTPERVAVYLEKSTERTKTFDLHAFSERIKALQSN